MSSSASSNSTDTITNVVFGITATTISIMTVWQGHRVWKMWREHASGQGNVTPVDIELGLQSVPSTPTTPEREDVVARSAPLADQAGDVAESGYTSQSPERQSSLPTTVDAETRPGPALVEGAWIDSNEVSKVNTDDAQTALTNMECQELRPTASDHL